MTTVSLSKRESVGVIGLGIMGSAMASHLAKAGFAVYGVDVSSVARKKMSRLLSHVDADLEGCLGACTCLITSLPSVAALDSVAEQIVARERDTKRRLPLVIAETSTLPHKEPTSNASRLGEWWPSDHNTMGGSRDTELKLFTVSPTGRSSRV